MEYGIRHRVIKKIILLIACVMTIFAALPITQSNSAYAASNPYSGGDSNCTYTAWRLAKSEAGVELPPWGNAGTWYASAKAAGFTVSTTPRAKSIVVYSGNPGHVAYVSSYDSSSNRIYKKEGGYLGAYHEGWGPAWESNMYGYIYLGNSTPTVPIGKEMTKGYDRVIPDGDYIIAKARNTDVSKKMFYFLDISGSDVVAKNSTNVQLWNDFADGIPSYDVWTLKYSNGFYTIKQRGSNMALDCKGGKYERGTNVQVYESLNNDSQKWAISEVWNGGACVGYRIQSKRNSYYVDVYDNGNAQRTNVHLWESNSSAAQQWEFIPYKPEQPVANDRYIIISSIDPTLTLDVAGNTSNVANNTNVQVWRDDTSSKYNSFDVKKLSNGYYSFTHAASGKSMDVKGSVCTASPGNVELFDSNGGLNQQWAITKQNDGYMIRARSSGFCLDIADGKNANGTNVRQLRYNSSKAQTWKFVPAEYAVTYNANGGNNAPASQIKYYKENLSLSNQIPSRPGYVFKGWTTNVSRQTVEYSAGGIYKQDANLMLFAVWEKNSAKAATETGNRNTTEKIEEEIIQDSDESDPINSEFSKLLLRSSKQTKNSISLKWKKVAGASRYIIYGNECGVQNKMVKLDTVAGTSKKFTKIAGKNIQKGTYYKFVVVAADNNKVVSISKMIHIATKGGKLGNHKSIKTAAKKNKLSLKNGKRFKLKAKAIAASKKNKISKHIGVRYESTNPRVAAVNKKGVITAKGKGKCTVYVYAQNGVYKAIKIRVK